MAADIETLENVSLTACSAGSSARGYVQRLAARKVRGFVGTIDSEGAYLSNIYLSAKSVGEAIAAADYHGRFLVELIQNANDVHPADRWDGEIEVLFHRSAGPHGTLYVANRGAPFGEANVDALCDVGLSSKPPGEAIGNKGLGFRSVRHVCDAPHIYSQAGGLGAKERFQGFCFRFAERADLAAMIDDPRHLDLAVRDLPHFHVPVWLVEQPAAVRAFATRAFATVITLPVRSANAAVEVLNEIEAIRTQKVPMLLFLSRLARLTIRVVEANGFEHEPLPLSRETTLELACGSVSIVDLGPAGRHLIARRGIDEATMLAAIREGVKQKQLHTQWREWKGEGEVALAVRLDGVIADPRLFTFLPLGNQAASPFRGHLHASFFPTANRKGLDGKVSLNALLLDEAASLAAETVAWLVAGEEGSLADACRAHAVVDLMCWRKVSSFETAADLPAVVAQRIGAKTGVSTLDDAPVVPVLAMSSGAETIAWRPPRSTRRWTFGGSMFSVHIAATHAEAIGSWPIWTGLGDALDCLIEYLKGHSPAFTEAPTAPERAELAARVAASLSVCKPMSTAQWTDFYKQLPGLLEAAGAALANKTILLSEEGELHRAMSSVLDGDAAPRIRPRRTSLRTAVFSPPARRGVQGAELERLSPPAVLAENFALLSDKLDWYGELSDARAFLERHKLVLEFDRDGI